jgi:DNA invertase Pin-like site-specific DNA recombinase
MIYGYTRVSTDDQAISSDNQRQEIEAYAAKHGLEVANIFQDEDVSGKIPMRDRPQGKLLWATLREGDLVIVTKLDRGWRSTADAASTLAIWKQVGIRMAILDFPVDTATDEGEMMFTQFASWAQYERKRIGRRVSEAWQYLKRNGKPYTNARPYGWTRSEGEWIPLHEERRIADRVLAMREDGFTWEGITLRLARDDVRKPVVMRTGARGYYSPSDVWSLARAAKAGYPTSVRVRAATGARPGKRSARGYRCLPIESAR